MSGGGLALESGGNLAALLATAGAAADAIVAAGAVGTLSAKLRRATQGLEDLKTAIVLAAGTNAIGKLAANSGVDIGDVDVTSLPALAAGSNEIGGVNVVKWVGTAPSAAAALADNASTPTAPAVGAFGMLWDGSSGWDRMPANQEGVLLASASRTATTPSSAQTNRGHRGVIVWFNVTAALAAGTALVQIEGFDPASSQWVILNQTPQGAGAGFTGVLGLELSPGANGGTNSAAGYMIQRISGTLPRVWRVNVVHSTGNSITYSVGYSLMR